MIPPSPGLIEITESAVARRPVPVPHRRGTTSPKLQATVAADPPRPAWIEIDLGQLRRNFRLIRQVLPPGVKVVSVIKDEAYGHGGPQVARVATESGIEVLAVSTIDEALALRQEGHHGRLLLLGDRHESELSWCVAHDLTCCISEGGAVRRLAELAARSERQVRVHMKINTGMNRYGVHWTNAAALARAIHSTAGVCLEGLLSHFAQSDETDKTFALLQLSRFEAAVRDVRDSGVKVPWRHLCNSGGFLDLPQAHFELVRLGILPLGVYPSAVCRRIPGIASVMTVKARLAAIQHLQPGDSVGYGMRYTAGSPRRIAVLPIGYGDGFPRVRNQGFVLVHSKRAPLVGGVAMDALTVDISEVPEAKLWDEAVLMGRQGPEEISVHEVAKLKNSVSYDVLTGWRSRLPRVYLDGDQA